jgi:hypothetical protein
MIDALLLGIVIPLSHNGPNGHATRDGGSGYYDDVPELLTDSSIGKAAA